MNWIITILIIIGVVTLVKSLILGIIKDIKDIAKMLNDRG